MFKLTENIRIKRSINDARNSSLLFEYYSGLGAGTRRVELFNSDTNIWDSSSDWTYNINSDW